MRVARRASIAPVGLLSHQARGTQPGSTCLGGRGCRLLCHSFPRSVHSHTRVCASTHSSLLICLCETVLSQVSTTTMQVSRRPTSSGGSERAGTQDNRVARAYYRKPPFHSTWTCTTGFDASPRRLQRWLAWLCHHRDEHSLLKGMFSTRVCSKQATAAPQASSSISTSDNTMSR